MAVPPVDVVDNTFDHAAQMLRLVDRGATPSPDEAKAVELQTLASIAQSLDRIATALEGRNRL